ncbi:cell division ATP-binding protein FtsE [Corynebacterium ulceribovis]|uniref:cell division ATP-binding protein FtsE n=1 Tax=Corynebacterium ulceribovis TaxID=487732 RepID=UPI000378F08B|nr:cell division ATP-binding protein FtsE [Corynebacterium ulceribovis]
MIVFDEVTKSYETSTRPALDRVSLTIDKGEFVFLIGPSGSGKSTFLELLIREENVTSGDIHIGDMHVNALKGGQVPKLRQKIGYVFQDFRLLPRKNVFDNVAFALQVIGKRNDVIKRDVPEVLDMVGLGAKADRMPAELSGGEQQRVAIARAYVNRPLILLADEPTGNLDPETAQGIMTLLERINRRGTTVIMSTHDNETVDAMRRRVIELELGKVVRDDATGVYGIGR